MKRSEMIENIKKYVYDATDCRVQIDTEEARLILGFIEKANFRWVDSVDDYETHMQSYEPEEGWDAWEAEQDRKDKARDFEVLPMESLYTGKPYTNRSMEVAQKFLDGKSFEELATEYGVTHERIRQLVAKQRYIYQKRVNDLGSDDET